MNEINFYRKSHEYGFLSNFWPSPMRLYNQMYPTNEHFYQSRKTIIDDFGDWIRNAPTPYLAMKAGRALRMDKDEMWPQWDTIKFDIMEIGLRAKFTQNPDLKEKLLATGDAILHEDSPNDMVWGKKGQDMLGKLLMKIRSELRGDSNK